MGELDRLNFNSTLKPGELTQKDQGHIAHRPVALFCDDQLGFPGHLLFSFLVRLVILGADNTTLKPQNALNRGQDVLAK